MLISRVQYIKYKFPNGEEDIKTAAELKKCGSKSNCRAKGVLINMKSFLTKVIKDVVECLRGTNHFCEIEFVRETENRKDNGSGYFAITYKGPIFGPALLTEFENEFNIKSI